MVSALKNATDRESLLELSSGAINDGAPAWAELYKRGISLPVGDFMAERTFDSVKGQASDGEEKQEPGSVEAARAVWLAEIEEFANGIIATELSSIARASIRRIQNVIVKGLQDGESIPQIAKRIDAIYGDNFIPHRSALIARTETIRASNFGSQQGAAQTGLPLEKEWIATPGPRTRDGHANADGQLRELEAPYEVDNASGQSENLMFPGDISLGASASNVINCRCTEGYVVKQGEGAEVG